jgi:hypothetical protein
MVERAPLVSRNTGLALKPEANFLWLIDVTTGEPCSTFKERIAENARLRAGD